MIYHLSIRRCDGAAAPSRVERFAVESDGALSVAAALEEINARVPLRDEQGTETTPVVWECSCLEKKCGACAMVISGKPRLACATFLRDAADRGGNITLAPLSKFPLRQDLAVDRAALFAALGEMELWLADAAAPAEEESVYQAASCLSCGLCLEVCPGIRPGGTFAGAAAVPESYRILMQSGASDHRRAMAKEYRKKVYGGCAKSLACSAVCPAGIPLSRLMARSNAAAVWGRRKGGR